MLWISHEGHVDAHLWQCFENPLELLKRQPFIALFISVNKYNQHLDTKIRYLKSCFSNHCLLLGLYPTTY